MVVVRFGVSRDHFRRFLRAGNQSALRPTVRLRPKRYSRNSHPLLASARLSPGDLLRSVGKESRIDVTHVETGRRRSGHQQLVPGVRRRCPAQNATKKKAAIKPVQADEDDFAAVAAHSDTNEDGGRERVAVRRAPKRRQAAPPQARVRCESKMLSPELEKILKDWELQTSQFKTMAGGFTRFKYDKTLEVEKRAEGKFVYKAPDKGNYELWGAKIRKGAVSQEGRTRMALPFELKPDEPERWVCNGKKVIKINDKEKTYEEVQIPPESQGQNIIDGPLPFLFGMKAEKAKLRYKLSLLKHKNPDEIWLQVIPRNPGDSNNWVKAKVIIEAKTFKPKAVISRRSDRGRIGACFQEHRHQREARLPR